MYSGLCSFNFSHNSYACILMNSGLCSDVLKVGVLFLGFLFFWMLFALILITVLVFISFFSPCSGGFVYVLMIFFFLGSEILTWFFFKIVN